MANGDEGGYDLAIISVERHAFVNQVSRLEIKFVGKINNAAYEMQNEKSALLALRQDIEKMENGRLTARIDGGGEGIRDALRIIYGGSDRRNLSMLLLDLAKILEEKLRKEK